LFSRWVFTGTGLDLVVVCRRGERGGGGHAGDSEYFFQTVGLAQVRAFDVEAFSFEASKTKLDSPTLVLRCQRVDA
jgi:hypothetical protein